MRIPLILLVMCSPVQRRPARHRDGSYRVGLGWAGLGWAGLGSAVQHLNGDPAKARGSVLDAAPPW